MNTAYAVRVRPTLTGYVAGTATRATSPLSETSLQGLRMISQSGLHLTGKCLVARRPVFSEWVFASATALASSHNCPDDAICDDLSNTVLAHLWLRLWEEQTYDGNYKIVVSANPYFVSRCIRIRCNRQEWPPIGRILQHVRPVRGRGLHSNGLFATPSSFIRRHRCLCNRHSFYRRSQRFRWWSTLRETQRIHF